VTYLPHPTDKVGIGIARDVTERKRREADQLELALQRERVETLKTFISDVSHDLMTPITIVNSALYLLRKSTTPEKTAERLKQIETQVARLEKMISDMLTMARLDRSQRDEFTFEEADLNAFVGHVMQEFQSNAAARHQTLDFTADSALPPLPFDSDKLHRALANLIDNALRYTPEEGYVRLSTGIKDSLAFIEVKDSGIGIAPKDQSRIFERFFRGSAHRPSGSMGLGLPIARTIVRRMGAKSKFTAFPERAARSGSCCR
jgi:signal transduction histidine kinase